MKKIYITETQLNSMIAEALSEVSYNKLDAAGDAIEYGRYEDGEFPRPSLIAIEDALETLQNALEHHYSDSKQIRIFMNYVSEMRAFFERKQEQGRNFYDAANAKKQEYNEYLLNLARTEFGYEGTDLQAFVKQISGKDTALYDEGNFSEPYWNSFLNKISDPDIRKYAENNL